jgi:beta-N-acetylhexosaminidase
MAMTAHIVFDQIDRNLPATISPEVVNTIMREVIGFDGLILTDDINMHALSGSVAARAEQAIAAGCDIVLHCSGEIGEMQSLLNVASNIEGKTLERVNKAQNLAFKDMPDICAINIKEELDSLIIDYD